MVLGTDPVTGEAVKPTLKGVIYAVLDLIDGGDKIKENLEKSKTVEKAAAWFKAEVNKLDLTWDGIKALFSQAWDAFKVADLLNPKLLFEKMCGDLRAAGACACSRSSSPSARRSSSSSSRARC